MNNTVAKEKIFGDFSSELKRAGLSIASTQILRMVKRPVAKQLAGFFKGASEDEAMMFLNSPVGESMLSFMLAGALNMLPTEKFVEERASVAQNLRVGSYIKVGGVLISAIQPVLIQALVNAKEFQQISE